MNKQHEVWIVDDDRSIRWVLERALEREEITTRSFESADKVMARLAKFEPDVIITDIRMPGTDGFGLLRYVQDHHPKLPVIIMTAYADPDRAVAAFRGRGIRVPAETLRCRRRGRDRPACLAQGARRPGQWKLRGIRRSAGDHRLLARDAGSVSRHRAVGQLQHDGPDHR